MLTQIFKRFASYTKVHGNLKDSDRIFTNVYQDSDAYIKGALRRVSSVLFRAIGTEPKIFSSMVLNGLSVKSKLQASEVEVALVSLLDSNTPSCPR